MSFYEPQGWQAPVRQASWEQPAPPSRSGASSTTQSSDTIAFATQFEEVDRAVDNLVKSGKIYPNGPRREHAPAAHGGPGRQFDHAGPRFHGNRHSVSDGPPVRTGSASNMQNYYASQRFQGRPSEVDPMMQAKRRMAAQRERELRNYHQEQQYNRKGLLAEMASNKSERSMSPSTMSEEGRRELIARQHRALYGAEGFSGAQGQYDEASNREQNISMPNSATSASHGQSPKGADPFSLHNQGQETNSQKPGSAERNVVSPTAQQGPNKIPTPTGAEDQNHTRQMSKSTTAPLTGGMAPIGSRPAGQHAPNQPLNKRATSPLPPSLGYGFGNGDINNERSQSSNSNANNQKDPNSTMGTWGTGSGVWGSNKIGATSVWG